MAGSTIILDNAERRYYDPIHELLAKEWSAKRTTNGIWRTDFFQKDC